MLNEFGTSSERVQNEFGTRFYVHMSLSYTVPALAAGKAELPKLGRAPPAKDVVLGAATPADPKANPPLGVLDRPVEAAAPPS